MGFYKNTSYNRHIHRSIKKDIIEQLTKTKKSSYSNLSKQEPEVLEQLKRRYDFIIASAEKCGAIVIHSYLYIKEAGRQLNDTKNHRPLPNHPAKINNDAIKKAIERFLKKSFD